MTAKLSVKRVGSVRRHSRVPGIERQKVYTFGLQQGTVDREESQNPPEGSYVYGNTCEVCEKKFKRSQDRRKHIRKSIDKAHALSRQQLSNTICPRCGHFSKTTAACGKHVSTCNSGEFINKFKSFVTAVQPTDAVTLSAETFLSGPGTLPDRPTPSLEDISISDTLQWHQKPWLSDRQVSEQAMNAPPDNRTLQREFFHENEFCAVYGDSFGLLQADFSETSNMQSVPWHQVQWASFVPPQSRFDWTSVPQTIPWHQIPWISSKIMALSQWEDYDLANEHVYEGQVENAVLVYPYDLHQVHSITGVENREVQLLPWLQTAWLNQQPTR